MLPSMRRSKNVSPPAKPVTLARNAHDERTEHERDDPEQDPHRQAHRCGADLVLRAGVGALAGATDRARGVPPAPLLPLAAGAAPVRYSAGTLSSPRALARTGTRSGRRPRRGGA